MKGPIPILLPALVALSISVALGLLAFLAGRARPYASPDRRRAVFRYRFLLRSVALFASVFLPAAVTFLVLLPLEDRVDRLAIAGAYFVIGMVCAPLLWECAWFYVALDDHGITHRSAWRGLRVFSWHDVSELSYSTLNMWFIVRFENGAKVRVPVFVSNLKDFLGQIERHLPVDAFRQARKGYEKVGRPFPALVNDPVLEARPPR